MGSKLNPVRGERKKKPRPNFPPSPHHLNAWNRLGKAVTKVVLRPAVFVNFRKAFDSVNNQLVLKKSPGYGIKNNELRWFENYLTGRCQSGPSRSKSPSPG